MWDYEGLETCFMKESAVGLTLYLLWKGLAVGLRWYVNNGVSGWIFSKFADGFVELVDRFVSVHMDFVISWLSILFIYLL